MHDPGFGAQARREILANARSHWFAPRKQMSTMSMDRSRRDFPVKTHGLRRRSVVGVPAWYLRLQLSGILQEIERLEILLAGEFGLSETQPVIDDLKRLTRERDVLVKRLASKF